ncbi:MAG: molybdopterin molybdotransferase MoeA [Deltaproteobacteria bacterium]
MIDIPFHEALRYVLEQASPLGVETVPLEEATGRILAEEIVAPFDMPGADNSAMDGFAVRSEECTGPAALTIAGYRPAGSTGDTPTGRNAAVRIMTGAPIPEGFDAVVPLEEAVEEGGTVRIPGPVTPGAHVRRKGEDIAQGDLVLRTGTVLRPPEISLIASFGRTGIPVTRKPTVAILATGDELVEPGEEIRPGAIVNSNSYSLASAVREAGADPRMLGIARDSLPALRKKLADGLTADVLITSAGVSAGDRDLVREALSGLGVREIFWKVRMRPGRPFAFGRKGNRPVFSLPGNPVSALITFEMLVRPALRALLGDPVPVKPFVQGVLSEPIRKKAGRIQFLRVRAELADGVWRARSAGDQSTGILRSLVRGNGIAVLPEDRTEFRAGERVDLLPLYPRC